jgi:ubiquinol-cytochrome c reductase cytochrome b subunit
LPHGKYIEMHEQVDKYEMWKLVDYQDYKPARLRPNAKGKITLASRVRVIISRIYFEERISPVSKNRTRLSTTGGWNWGRN